MTEKVLVVDDDPGFCTMLSKVLEEQRYSVDTAFNGEEGLKKVKEVFYDLIVLDMKMPKMGGIEFLQQLRALQAGKSESTVIVITGYVSNNTPIDALKLGVGDYLIKPFELIEFLRSVERNMKLVRVKKERDKYMNDLAQANSDLKSTIEELQATRDRLLLSEKLATVGQVAYSVGHELRNPLESIQNFAYLIEKSGCVKDDKSKRYVSLLFKGIEQASNIVDELLSFSKEKKLNILEISCKDLVKDTVESMLLNENIKIKTEVSVDKVFLDPSRIRQVLTNLVTNAAQAMSEKGGEIKIAVTKDEENIKFEVIDQGPGISEERIRSIFDPFFTTKAEGIGLGLAIVREIVKKHNGKIEVKSKENFGTTFTVVIPLDLKPS